MDIENTEDQTITDVLSAAYDQVEAGQTAPEPETLEIDTAPDPVIDASADSADNPEQNPGPEDGALENPDGEQPQGKEQADQPIEAATEDHAPSSWKTDIAQKWSDLPSEVRAEINRREADYHKGIESYKEYSRVGQVMEQAISPYMRNIEASGVQAPQAIHQLLKVEDALRNGDPVTKAQTLVNMAQQYGIDIAGLQNVPKPDPQVVQLQQRLDAQNAQFQQYQQRDQEVVLSEIEKFKNDPSNVHFEAVQGDMALLLQSNRAESLKDAYDKAVWMRPDIRKSLVEQQRTEAEQKATIQAREKRAKAAAVGIKGSGLSKGGAINPNASLRETIAAAMDGNA